MGDGGAKHRLEPSDPANVSTIDGWGDEGTCNHHDNDDLSHQPPWELSDYGSSLTLRFAVSAGSARGKNYTTLTQQLGGCRKEGGEKLYDDGEIDDVLEEDKHEDDAGARSFVPTDPADSTENRGRKP